MQDYNLLTTLGSGSLLTFFVFFVFYKLMRFGGKQAALATAAFMLLLYVPLASLNWPGLDTFAIHFAFFMMIAYGLGMITGIRAERFKQQGKDGQKQKKWHIGPTIIIGFFITLAIVDSIIITLATKGLNSEWMEWLLPESKPVVKHLDDESRALQEARNKYQLDDEFKAFYIDNEADGQSAESRFPGTVSYNLQKREADYNAYMARLQAQKERGWQLDGGWLAPVEQQKAATFQVKMRDAQQQPLTGAQVEVDFLRPSNQHKDQKKLLLAEQAAGMYQINVTLPEAGLWSIHIRVTKNGDLHEVRGKTTVIPQGK
ncbi:MAG: FixH family protein [bacterium]